MRDGNTDGDYCQDADSEDNDDECDVEQVVFIAGRANRCGWMVAHYRPQSPNIDHYLKIGAQYSTWCFVI